MPLSLPKLQDLLVSKGFIPSTYFILDDSIFYIELFSVKSAEIFLLYIPSKYNFVINSSRNVYKIRYIDMTAESNVTDEYTGGADNVDVEGAYGNMNVELSPDKDRMEEHLEDNYKHTIALGEISKEDISSLKSIYRQMRRLRYCVQNLKYKLGIVYKNYMCSIRRDDSIDCFSLKHYPRKDCKKLFVIIDLETFYAKSEKIIEDVKTVKESIFRVLERNQGMHSRVIGKILENKKDIDTIPDYTQNKKDEYMILVQQLEQMLITMAEAERKILDELIDIKNTQPTGLQSDIGRAHTKARLEKEYDRIKVIQGQITSNIILLQEKISDSVLNVDDLMFDSTVMFDAIIKNFSRLKDFC